MTGVEATEEMTLEQLEAMSGGELLRSEVSNWIIQDKYFCVVIAAQFALKLNILCVAGRLF